MENNKIQVYSAESIYKKGLFNIFKEMIFNLIEQKELIWQLFLRDFKVRYKQSLLGWAWIFLMPLITMGTFLLLNISGVIRIGEIPVPYPIFGLLGFSLWQAFSNGWPVLTRSITSGGALISQVSFPREVLVIAPIGQIIVDFLIRLSLVLLVYLIYGLSPSIYFLFFPLYLLPIFLLTLGLGFLTAILEVIIRDTQNFINVGVSFFLFLMPIMYTMPEKGFLAKVNRYNPIYFLIDTPRSIIISGTIKNPLEFLLASILAFLVFLIGWFIFYISQTKLAERI
jgi:lipopolysaccharide transport system permease protein